VREQHIYKVVHGEYLLADVVTPSQAGGSPQAAVVCFHGGGWVEGSPGAFERHCLWLAEHGAVGVMIEYCLLKARAESVLDCIRDAHSAVRWVRANAERFHIDPSRIAAMGGSAGGHLAACTAMIDIQEPDENQAVSSRPDALVLFNPALDTGADAIGAHDTFPQEGIPSSPMHHITPGLPGCLILNGCEDTLTPIGTAERFTEQMVAAGNDCRLVAYPGEPHSWFRTQFEQTFIREVVPFLGEQGLSIAD
jgi:acetyl esterase